MNEINSKEQKLERLRQKIINHFIEKRGEYRTILLQNNEALLLLIENAPEITIPVGDIEHLKFSKLLEAIYDLQEEMGFEFDYDFIGSGAFSIALSVKLNGGRKAILKLYPLEAAPPNMQDIKDEENVVDVYDSRNLTNPAGKIVMIAQLEERLLNFKGDWLQTVREQCPGLFTHPSTYTDEFREDIADKIAESLILMLRRRGYIISSTSFDNVGLSFSVPPESKRPFTVKLLDLGDLPGTRIPY
jgi:hypothetical protein